MSEPMLRIQAPAVRLPERQWALAQVLTRRLGLSFSLEPSAGDEVVVQAPGGCLRWPDRFLTQADPAWRQADSLPALPWSRWPLSPEQRTAIGADDIVMPWAEGVPTIMPGEVRLPLDVAGSVFFMLSRYEESVVGAPRDRHGRFPGQAGLAWRDGHQGRPLVDEWVALLAWALAPLLPSGGQRPAPAADIWVSCDVDLPYAPGQRSLRGGLRHAASLVVNERRPGAALSVLGRGMARRAGWKLRDPVDTFDHIMDLNESHGRRVTFFFIARRAAAVVDGGYTLQDPPVAALLRRIVSRGHEVALHGSYGSVDEPGAPARERAELQQAVSAAGGTAIVEGMRQHYLRWYGADQPGTGATAPALARAGLAWDATLGHADAPGFRCGTSHPFALFDLDRREALPLLERPLVLMEASLLSRHYGGLPAGEVALQRGLALRAACERHGGCFSLLWHNDHLLDDAQRALYAALLEPGRAPMTQVGHA
ncbi:MAG: polysaccharide deacetylase family protein [Aquabacterium sp.]